jgi:hypothetical protein
LKLQVDDLVGQLDLERQETKRLNSVVEELNELNSSLMEETESFQLLLQQRGLNGHFDGYTSNNENALASNEKSSQLELVDIPLDDNETTSKIPSPMVHISNQEEGRDSATTLASEIDDAVTFHKKVKRRSEVDLQAIVNGTFL